MQWAQEIGPLGIFILLVLGSFGLPVAKSLLLLLAGMLAQQNQELLVPYFIATVLGLHGGDFSLFIIGWILDDKLFKLKLIKKVFSDKKIEKARNLVSKHGLYSIVVIRFTPYIRGLCYLMLGSLKMNVLRMTIINISVCTIYSLMFFLPGYFLVTQVDELKKISRYGNTVLGIVFIILMVGFFIFWKYKKRKATSCDFVS